MPQVETTSHPAFFLGTEEGVDFSGDADGDLPGRVGSPQVHVASVIWGSFCLFLWRSLRPWFPVGLQSVALHHGFELLD